MNTLNSKEATNILAKTDTCERIELSLNQDERTMLVESYHEDKIIYATNGMITVPCKVIMMGLCNDFKTNYIDFVKV